MDSHCKKCDATGKTIFKYQNEAKKAIFDIKTKTSYKPQLKRKRKRKDGNVQRSYYCKYCSGYHLTSHNIDFKKNSPINKKVKDFFNTFDITNWKNNSLPFPDNILQNGTTQ
jgi:hypothetical protein